MKRVDGPPFPPNDPRAPVAKVLQRIFLSIDRDSDLQPFFAQPFPSNDELLTIDDIHHGFSLSSASASFRELVPPAYFNDAQSLFDTRIEGLPELGFRIRYSIGPGRAYVFVVGRKDGWYLLPVDTSLSVLAEEAASSLLADDLGPGRMWLQWAYDLQHSEIRLFDPLAGTPFARVWPTLDPQNANDQTLAVALLRSQGRGAADAYPLLARTWRSTTDESRRLQLERALAEAAARTERWRESADHWAMLRDRFPRSTEMALRYVRAAVRAGAGDEARDWADQRLKQDPDDQAALAVVAELAFACEDWNATLDCCERLSRLGNESQQVRYIWAAMQLDPRSEDAFRRATKMYDRMPQVYEPLAVRLLMTIRLERGEVAAARELMLLAVDLDRNARPDAAVWYLQGRLAERAGLPEIARVSYERVATALPCDPLDYRRLATQRLATLPTDQ